MNQKRIYNKFNIYKEILVLITVFIFYNILSNLSFNYIDINKNTAVLSVLSSSTNISFFQFGLTPYIITTFLFSLFSWLIPSCALNKKEGISGHIKNKKIILCISMIITVVTSLSYMSLIINNNLFYSEYQTLFHYLSAFFIVCISSISLICCLDIISKYSLINGTSSIIASTYFIIIYNKYLLFKKNTENLNIFDKSNTFLILTTIVLICLVFFYNYYVKKIKVSYPIKEVLYEKYANVGIAIPLKLNSSGMFAVLLTNFFSPLIASLFKIEISLPIYYLMLFLISFVFAFTQANCKNICNSILKNNGLIKQNYFNIPINVFIIIDVFLFSAFSSTILIFIFICSELTVKLLLVDTGVNLASLIIVFSNIILEIFLNVKKNIKFNYVFNT